MIDPHLFSPEAVDSETERHNAEIIATLSALPDPWSLPAALIREKRARGEGPFPLPARSPRAVVETVAHDRREATVRIIAPERPRAVILHIHGGGWRLGAPDLQDHMLEAFAVAGIASVSVKYRLAPEFSWPAGPDDCETAALWLAGAARDRFGTDRIFIGGESAGGHLAALTMLRLRDRHRLTPFTGAVLNYGCFDLGATPSCRRFGNEPLILTTRDMLNFVGSFLQDRIDPRSPEVSPLYADLSGLPPALLSVGTRDALLDDSLFMHARYLAAGGRSDLAIYPGACHGFTLFDNALSTRAFDRMIAFMYALA